MNKAKIVEKLIEEKGLSKRQFALSIGLPPTTLQTMLKRGLGNAAVENVIKICKGLGITVEELDEMSKTNSTDDIVKEVEPTYSIKSTEYPKYPYFPVAISAGLPHFVEAIENDDVEYISVPDEIMGRYAGRKDIYFMKVNGDSMNNIIPHNSLIGVEQITLSNLKNGDIVVYSDGNEYSVKRFFKFGDKLVFRPDSTDEAFTDYITSVDNEDLVIHGKVVIYIVNLN